MTECYIFKKEFSSFLKISKNIAIVLRVNIEVQHIVLEFKIEYTRGSSCSFSQRVKFSLPLYNKRTNKQVSGIT